MRLTVLVGWLTLSAGAAAAEPLEVTPDAEIIRGRVQKPEVVVVIRRENLDRGFVLDLKESFLDRIVEAVRLPPF